MILGLTGHANDIYRVEGETAGMDGVLKKPIYYDVLVDWIKKVM